MTNPIESAFSTIRLRTRVKGHKLQDRRAGDGLTLPATAQERRRRFNGRQLLADVLDSAKFNDGI